MCHVGSCVSSGTQSLVLDEPTNHLDITHQIDILRLVRTLVSAAWAVLHDIVMAVLPCRSACIYKRVPLFPRNTEDIVTFELLAACGGVGGCTVRPSAAGNGISIGLRINRLLSINR